MFFFTLFSWSSLCRLVILMLTLHYYLLGLLLLMKGNNSMSGCFIPFYEWKILLFSVDSNKLNVLYFWRQNLSFVNIYNNCFRNTSPVRESTFNQHLLVQAKRWELLYIIGFLIETLSQSTSSKCLLLFMYCPYHIAH